MKHRSLRPLLALIGLASFGLGGLHAQQTLVVDKDGGAGSQFTEIQPAIDAASPGDIVLVRPLTGPTPYNGFAVSKSLSILGGPGVRVTRAGLVSMTVEDLPAGGLVVLRGLEESPSGGPFLVQGLVVQENQGSVHCEDLQIETLTSVLNSRQASFETCSFADVQITSSEVLLTECTAQGYFDGNCGCGKRALDIGPGSRVTIANGTYIGGEEGPSSQPPTEAIAVLGDAKLFLTGNSGTTILAGKPTPFAFAALATTSPDGEIVLDPDPRIEGGIAGPGTVTTVRIPYLHTSLSGTSFTTTVETWPGAIVRLYYSPFVAPFAYSPTTPDVWVGLPRRIVSGAAPASGIRVDSFTLPPLNAGTSFPLQAVVLHQGQIYLSNPVVSVLAQ